jgi:hypothetical protein
VESGGLGTTNSVADAVPKKLSAANIAAILWNDAIGCIYRMIEFPMESPFRVLKDMTINPER